MERVAVIDGESPRCPLVRKTYYDPGEVNGGSLTRLVSWRRSLDPAVRADLDTWSAWPRSVVIDGDRAIGTLMSEVPTAYSEPVQLPSGTEASVLNELQFLMAPPELLAKRRRRVLALEQRLAVLGALASAMSFLHEHDIAVGDVSTKNCLWNDADSVASVFLVDCDAVRLLGTVPAVVQANTPGWNDPAFPGGLNHQSDVYKFALTVLRTITQRFHERDPAAASGLVDRPIATLLRASLTADVEARPALRSWAAVLGSEALPSRS